MLSGMVAITIAASSTTARLLPFREHADPIADGDCDGRLQVAAVGGTPSPGGASHHLIAAILSKSGSAGSLAIEVAERAPVPGLESD